MLAKLLVMSIVIMLLGSFFLKGGLFYNGGVRSLNLEKFTNGQLYYDGDLHLIKDKWNAINRTRVFDIKTINDSDLAYKIDYKSNKVFVIGSNGFQVISVNGLGLSIKEYTNLYYEYHRDPEASLKIKNKAYGKAFTSIHSFSDFSVEELSEFKALIEKIEFDKAKKILRYWKKEEWPYDI